MPLDRNQCFLFFPFFFKSSLPVINKLAPIADTRGVFSLRLSGEYEGYISCDKKYIGIFLNNS